MELCRLTYNAPALHNAPAQRAAHHNAGHNNAGHSCKGAFLQGGISYIFTALHNTRRFNGRAADRVAVVARPIEKGIP